MPLIAGAKLSIAERDFKKEQAVLPDTLGVRLKLQVISKQNSPFLIREIFGFCLHAYWHLSKNEQTDHSWIHLQKPRINFFAQPKTIADQRPDQFDVLLQTDEFLFFVLVFIQFRATSQPHVDAEVVRALEKIAESFWLLFCTEFEEVSVEFKLVNHSSYQGQSVKRFFFEGIRDVD